MKEQMLFEFRCASAPPHLRLLAARQVPPLPAAWASPQAGVALQAAIQPQSPP